MKVKKRYAAAADSRLIGDWSPVDSNVNTIIGKSSASVRARIRQLVRDFPYFRRAVRLVTNYAVGDGIKFQACCRDLNGDLLTQQNQQIEDVFNFWADEADVAGKLHYYEMMHLAKTQDMECGEFLIVKTKPRRATKLPYALQMYEPEWLDGAISGNAKNPVAQGIEYDKLTGEVLAYHLTDPDSWGKSTRIPAPRVIHKFESQRPGQLRGISPLVAAVMMTHSLSDYLGAEVDAAKMAAKWLGSVETLDPYSIEANGLNEEVNDDRKYIEMENAIIETLEPGEKLNLMSNPRPGSNFTAFVKLLLTMLAVVAEVPYELLSGDYTGFSYSTGKISRTDFVQQMRPICSRHIRHFATPTTAPLLDLAVLHGFLKLPGYWSDPLRYHRFNWQPPGMESIDPGRETKSQIDRMKNNLTSPQEISKARGRDFGDIVRENQEAKKMVEAAGLDWGDVSLALKNNPAAIAEQK